MRPLKELLPLQTREPPERVRYIAHKIKKEHPRYAHSLDRLADMWAKERGDDDPP